MGSIGMGCTHTYHIHCPFSARACNNLYQFIFYNIVISQRTPMGWYTSQRWVKPGSVMARWIKTIA